MKTRTFLAFVAPSVIVMVTLIAIPLIGIAFLALHQSYVKTELVELTTEVPLIGGITRKDTRVVPQPVLDNEGNAIRVWEYVGGYNLANAADIEGLTQTFTQNTAKNGLMTMLVKFYKDIVNVDFWRALEFTLLYTFLTTPVMLAVGLGLALAINSISERLRGSLVFATLLPMIVTPIVSSLAVYWLFLDNSLISTLTFKLGFGRFYFLADQITIRFLIILYGIWFSAPFAFIILYAGLQTLPRDPIESAKIDGANEWQRLRYIIIPHLAPLLTVIALIHIMDAYRVFEPILVFSSDVYASSVQYLTYFVLSFEDNVHKAAAYSILTIIGVVILLIPVLRQNFKKQRFTQ